MLKHFAAAGSFTRNYTYGTTSNRLQGTVVGSDSYNYSHDVRGNMTSMPHLGTMEWNRQNELNYLADATLSTWDAYYQYSGGQRIRKVLEKAGGIREERIYLGGFEIYRKFTKKALTLERTTMHVADDTGRIAMVERRTLETDAAPALLKRFIYANHLQSASLELNDAAQIISYEEYHPYGTTAYQATNAVINTVAKRYRYTGKERDEESGLYYHGARYYVPWLCRWCAVEPLESKYAGKSPYQYCSCNPTTRLDPDGRDDIHFFSYIAIQNIQVGGIWQQIILEHRSWMSVVKNDSPNTYTLHQAGVRVDDQGNASRYDRITPLKSRFRDVGKYLVENQASIDRIYPPVFKATGARATQADVNRSEVYKFTDQYRSEQKYYSDRAKGMMLMVDIFTVGESVLLLEGLVKSGLTKFATKAIVKQGTSSATKQGLLRNSYLNYGTEFIDDGIRTIGPGIVSDAGPTLNKFNVPSYYTYTTQGQRVFVAPNAMKHLTEIEPNRWYLGHNYFKLAGQTHIRAINSAIDDILSQGPIKYNVMYRSSGNEIMFSAPRNASELPAVKHFQQIPK